MSRLADVETAIYNHIDGLLTTTGSIGELPRAADAVDVALWMFALEGGSTVFTVRETESTYAWTMAGYFRGMYKTRATAQTDLWTIMDNLPVSTGDVSEIQRLDAAAPPSIRREIVELDNDLGEGGPLRVWLVEIPFIITFARA
jgi:hypothetical protein